MRYFFIDLENVRSEGLEGVLSLTAEDVVFIFYSENAMNLSIPMLESLNNSKASAKFIKTNYIGKNAMDFQIVSLFGAMIERNKAGSYYIISQDNGFKSAVSFCEQYFEDYGILCGVYPRIISAVTDELKKAGKRALSAPATQKTEKDKKLQKSEENRKDKKPQKAEEDKKDKKPQKAEEDKKDKKPQKAEENKKAEKTKKSEDAKKEEKPKQEDMAAALVTGDTATAEAATGDNSEAAEATEKKKRKRHRRKNKNAGNEGTESTEGVSTDAGDTEETGAEEENIDSGRNDADQSKSAGNKADRNETNRNKADRNETNRNKAGEPSEASAGETGHGRLEYIYEALSELGMSEKTIDLYADSIDAGLAGCNKAEELREFFTSRHGEDESEALYRIIRSDFDALKKKRPSAKRQFHRKRKK